MLTINSLAGWPINSRSQAELDPEGTEQCNKIWLKKWFNQPKFVNNDVKGKKIVIQTAVTVNLPFLSIS